MRRWRCNACDAPVDLAYPPSICAVCGCNAFHQAVQPRPEPKTVTYGDGQVFLTVDGQPV